jgi:hypothetical protein
VNEIIGLSPLCGLTVCLLDVACVVDEREEEHAVLVLKNIDGAGILTNAPEIMRRKPHGSKQGKTDDKVMADEHNRFAIVQESEPLQQMGHAPAYPLE